MNVHLAHIMSAWACVVQAVTAGIGSVETVAGIRDAAFTIPAAICMDSSPSHASMC